MQQICCCIYSGVADARTLHEPHPWWAVDPTKAAFEYVLELLEFTELISTSTE